MFRTTTRLLAWFSVLATTLPAPALGAVDAGALVPAFREGDIITLDQIEKLRPFLPEEFWDYRDLFFYEGMRLEIGPSDRDYGPAAEYLAATERYRGEPRIGPDNSLENYTAGQPFPMDEIDCLGDPHASAPPRPRVSA